MPVYSYYNYDPLLCVERRYWHNFLSPVSQCAHPAKRDVMLNMATALFMLFVVVWSLVLIHVPAAISDWHSLALSGLFIVYHCITIQSISATGVMLLLVSQTWFGLGEYHSCPQQLETFGKSTVVYIMLLKV